MSRIKNVLTVSLGLSLIIVLVALITPTKTKGQGGNPHTLNVNSVLRVSMVDRLHRSSHFQAS